ncbi:terpenoid synthase [Daldinia loculata]|uniref:terpenoid synthase n=1 Tax=Daldinia loculata TaxID=103429 RepID=UPI0020C1DD81|nr:terpenoid synthase [Daldinia loculata]KAI1652079.1 terpenoid synthase [Daldinia loculata]
MSTLSSKTDFELLLAKCIGQRVEIPDLFVLCPWDVEVSPLDEKLGGEIELWRLRWINDPTSLKRNRIVNSCLFARGIAPKAAFDELVTVAKYQAWLYYWDDAYDFGDFDDKYEEIVAHQKQTIELLRESLFNEHPNSVDPTIIAPDYLTAQSIHEWGAIVGEKSVSSSLKNWFFKVLVDFITATFHLQSEFDKRSILDLETYWKIRMDSSAVFPTLAMVLFADQVAFPLWFFDHTLVQKAAELSNIIVWVTNDIVSARQELQCKHVDNLIPLLVHHQGITLQEAVNKASRIAHQAYLDFEALEPQLMKLGEDRNAVYEMRRFIASCRFVCTGIFNWTYHIKRYVHWEPGMDRASVSAVLGEDLL